MQRIVKRKKETKYRRGGNKKKGNIKEKIEEERKIRNIEGQINKKK